MNYSGWLLAKGFFFFLSWTQCTIFQLETDLCCIIKGGAEKWAWSSAQLSLGKKTHRQYANETKNNEPCTVCLWSSTHKGAGFIEIAGDEVKNCLPIQSLSHPLSLSMVSNREGTKMFTPHSCCAWQNHPDAMLSVARPSSPSAQAW